jgi:RNA polymerase sigma-70 factor, ECF subfamily
VAQVVSAIDDSSLVRRARAGDQRAYGELVLRHRPRIFSVLLRIARSRPDAENLCQEAFLKAYLSLGSFEERSSFSTWLYRIAINVGLNHAERLKRIVPWDQDVHENLLRTEDLGEDLEQRDALDRLREAIEGLPPRQKAAVLLRDYEGLSFAEVAEALDCPVGTAKANHFHAIRNLRKRLLEPEPDATTPEPLPAPSSAPVSGAPLP